MARKALGKGLDELLSIDDSSDLSEADVQELEIDNLYPNKMQPRKYFNEEKLNELAQSIKEKGLIQPIIVSKGEDGNFEIIVGERRWRASKIAGKKYIPCIVKEISHFSKLELALIENIQREDLNPIETAVSYQELLENLNLTQDELSKKIGKSRTAIANTMRLLKLSENLQKDIINDVLSEGHGRAILGLKDTGKIDFIRNKIIEENLNVRETEKLISSYNSNKFEEIDEQKEDEKIKEDEKEKIKRERESTPIKSIQDEKLSETFETPVYIKRTENYVGRIEINFTDLEEYNRIYDAISKCFT